MVLMARAVESFQDELGERLRHVPADGNSAETLARRLDLSPERIRHFASEPPVPASTRLGIAEDSLDRIAAAYRVATPIEGLSSEAPTSDQEQEVEKFRELLEDVSPEDFA
jgi:hypothetical protein